MHTKRRFLQVATVSLIGGTVLFGGLVAAGGLPGAAQGVASDMLEKVGVTVPDPNRHVGTYPDERGRSEAPTTPSPSDESTATPARAT